MTAFLWTMVCLLAFNIFISVGYFVSGTWPRQRPPLTPGAAMAALLTEIGFVAWALVLVLRP